jgi:hypothetical protein
MTGQTQAWQSLARPSLFPPLPAGLVTAVGACRGGHFLLRLCFGEEGSFEARAIFVFWGFSSCLVPLFVDPLVLFVLAVGSFAVSYLSKCSHISFFAIWFHARTRVRWVVSNEFVFALVFSPKPLVVDFHCFIFEYYFFVWYTGSGWCPPSFLIISFLLCLIYLG